MVRLSAVALVVFASLSEAWVPPIHRKPTPSRAFTSLQLSSKPSTYGEILLFNSKSREKEPFQPLEKDSVKMYTCGPTVYDSAHVGNFRAFLTYDILKRVLVYFGLNVNHICNLTDIDDKIIAKCLLDGMDLSTLTLKYERAFMKDLEKLNIVPANRYPRATQHIDDMVEMIQSLENKGLAYQTNDGSWYFSTASSPGYGQQLVSLSVEDMEQQQQQQTSNMEYDDGKRNWQDFCLWKAAKPGEPQDAIWDTQIGKGRPGWHLECSAMAKRFLGDTIDVHCGGIDLKFPHHENEIAQSEGSSGKPFCNCWIHNGFVNIGKEKMSKSLGNFLTLSEACPKPNDVRAYRYLVVTSHYRTDLSFTKQAMEASKKAVRRLDKVRTAIQETLALVVAVSTKEDETLVGSSDIVEKVVPLQMKNFQAALSDDLSMPRAAACLFALVKAAEAELKREENVDIQGLRAICDAMEDMDRVFGIFYKIDDKDGEEPEVPKEVMALVGQRAAAKEAKDWELADSLRARIIELGFMVKDVKGGEPIVSPVE